MNTYAPNEPLALLKQLPVFQGLDLNQLAEAEGYFQKVPVVAGQVIVEEGSPGDYFYIVFEGRFQVSQDQRYITTLMRGDYFGEEALLFHQPRSATIIAADNGILLRIDGEKFYTLIERYPQLRKNFSITAESRRLARKAEFDFLGKDEVIYLITRKHEIFLYLSLIPPIVMSLSGIPLAIIGALSTKLIWQLVLLFCAALFLGGGVVWGIWNQVNWGNDYYILTNQRVIWLENVIGFYSSRRETPLTAILAVNVLSSAWGRMLHYGSVDVRTYTGSILMRNMANPDIFEAFLRGHRERAYNRNRELEILKMKETLANRFKMDEQGLVPTKPTPPLKSTVEPPKPSSPTFSDFLDTFFKMRYEQNGVITYRKHWFVLIRKTWAPMLGFFILLGFTAYLTYAYQVLQEQWFFNGIIWSGIILLLLGIDLFWWGYNYLDWSNDIYRITPEQILDIEKKPLGKEEKKTASLDSILSVEHERKGLIQLIFNYGSVTINVGQTQFVFHGVAYPDQVHQDISAFMEARLRKKQEQEFERERERMADWLSVYRKQERHR